MCREGATRKKLHDVSGFYFSGFTLVVLDLTFARR
jgi:hypothetical protein